jgi:hypothetical protein
VLPLVISAEAADRRHLGERRGSDRRRLERRAPGDRRCGLPDSRLVRVERRRTAIRRRGTERRRGIERRTVGDHGSLAEASHGGQSSLLLDRSRVQGQDRQVVPRIEPAPAAVSQPVVSRPLVLLFLGLAALGTVLRFVGLDRQSYWGDELFSVTEASAKLSVLNAVALREIHTPLYAYLLHGWIRIGPGAGTDIMWTHLFSAVVGALSVVVAWWGLSRTAISLPSRALATAALATSGFAVVYAQETRPYALLLFAGTGLTAWTLRLLLPTPSTRRSRTLAGWALWALLAATVHLFGVVLLLACLIVLVARLRSLQDRLRVACLGALACAPQLAWIAWGITRPGFATGTSWIHAPGPGDVRDLVTTAFSAGGLEPHSDAFVWGSPWGVAAVAALGVAAGIQRWVSPTAVESADAAGTRDGAAALLLLAIAAVVIVGTYGVSQSVHLWTGRNLVVVLPALLWGTVVGLTALPRGDRTRVGLQAALGGLLAVQLVVVGVTLRQAYKTDFRGLVAYLEQVRAQQPDAMFVIDGHSAPGYQRFFATGQPQSTGGTLFSRARYYPRSLDALMQQRLEPTGTTVVVLYPGVNGRIGGEDVTQVARQFVARTGADAGCAPVPVYGLVIVRCDRP